MNRENMPIYRNKNTSYSIVVEVMIDKFNYKRNEYINRRMKRHSKLKMGN